MFGRNAILDLASVARPAPGKILEIGCGTGRNLLVLARRFPGAHLTGVDLSDAMLAIARRKTASFGPRVKLLQRSYDSALDDSRGHDLGLASYALSMFNPGFDQAIAAAGRDLAPGGRFSLVDFHATRLRWFSLWMGGNHVRMDGQLRPLLQEAFSAVADELHPAYGGAWQYLMFVAAARHDGRRPRRSAAGDGIRSAVRILLPGIKPAGGDE